MRKGYIYFILKNETVIYIGKTTTNIQLRVNSFISRTQTDYDEIYYIDCDIEQLNSMEIKYIKEFKPIHNIQYNFVKPRMKYIESDNQLERLINMVLALPDEVKEPIEKVLKHTFFKEELDDPSET